MAQEARYTVRTDEGKRGCHSIQPKGTVERHTHTHTIFWFASLISRPFSTPRCSSLDGIPPSPIPAREKKKLGPLAGPCKKCSSSEDKMNRFDSNQHPSLPCLLACPYPDVTVPTHQRRQQEGNVRIRQGFHQFCLDFSFPSFPFSCVGFFGDSALSTRTPSTRHYLGLGLVGTPSAPPLVLVR